ncbi:hypothetical protein [Streptomyces sp. NPDC016172]
MPTIEITGVHKSPAAADYYQHLPTDRCPFFETGSVQSMAASASP